MDFAVQFLSHLARLSEKTAKRCTNSLQHLNKIVSSLAVW